MSSTTKPITFDINNAMLACDHEDLAGKFIASKTVAENFFNTEDVGSGLLPPVIRSFSADYRFVMLEQAPMIATIQGAKVDKIAVPWTLWVMEFDKASKATNNVWIYAMKDALITGENILYVVDFPQLDYNGRVNDDVIPKKMNAFLALRDRIVQNTSLFWKSSFEPQAKGQETFLNTLAEHTVDSVLDIEMSVAPPPNLPDFAGAKVITANMWVEYMDLSTRLNHDVNTPLLEFLKGLIPPSEPETS